MFFDGYFQEDVTADGDDGQWWDRRSSSNILYAYGRSEMVQLRGDADDIWKFRWAGEGEDGAGKVRGKQGTMILFFSSGA